MKFALIGAAAVAAAAFVTPALAQGSSNPSSYGSYYSDNSAMATQAAEANAYRYHGGPKSND